MPIFHDLRIALHLALRVRMPVIALWMLVALAAAALLAAQFSARQPATIALDAGLSVIRLALPLLAILLVQELLVREIDRKLYLTSLTYPRPRYQWLLGRFLAIALLLLGLLALMGLLLAAVVTFAGSGYTQGTPVDLGVAYLLTLTFVFLDVLAILAMAVLLSITASTPSFVLIGTAGFMLIARSYTPIIELIRANRYLVEEIADPGLYQNSLTLLKFFLPDLGTLDVRMITLYGKLDLLPGDWPMLLLSTSLYIATLLALSVWILNRRKFG